MALRYVLSVQVVAYMWWNGRNRVQTGSKFAHLTCLCIDAHWSKNTFFTLKFVTSDLEIGGGGILCLSYGATMPKSYNFRVKK